MFRRESNHRQVRKGLEAAKDSADGCREGDYCLRNMKNVYLRVGIKDLIGLISDLRIADSSCIRNKNLTKKFSILKLK